MRFQVLMEKIMKILASIIRAMMYAAGTSEMVNYQTKE
jgi:hypothetical protein